MECPAREDKGADEQKDIDKCHNLEAQPFAHKIAETGGTQGKDILGKPTVKIRAYEQRCQDGEDDEKDASSENSGG